jgi:two-component system nitrogen regulation response regulator NtrX
LPLRQARAYFELQYVKAQLAFAEGNMSKAAEVIGMDRAALHRKLKSLEHGLWGQSLAESS